MTGITLELQSWQREELELYLDTGERAGYPSPNLVRRGFLTRVRTGVYAITPLGRSVLESAKETRMVTREAIPRAFRPQRSALDIVRSVQAIHYWIDEEIAKGRTDEEIVAQAPVAIAFINGDITLAELVRAIEETR